MSKPTSDQLTAQLTELETRQAEILTLATSADAKTVKKLSDERTQNALQIEALTIQISQAKQRETDATRQANIDRANELQRAIYERERQADEIYSIELKQIERLKADAIARRRALESEATDLHNELARLFTANLITKDEFMVELSYIQLFAANRYRMLRTEHERGILPDEEWQREHERYQAWQAAIEQALADGISDPSDIVDALSIPYEAVRELLVIIQPEPAAQPPPVPTSGPALLTTFDADLAAFDEKVKADTA